MRHPTIYMGLTESKSPFWHLKLYERTRRGYDRSPKNGATLLDEHAYAASVQEASSGQLSLPTPHTTHDLNGTRSRPHSEVPAKRASTKPETWAALSRVQEVAYQKLSRVLLRPLFR